MDNEVFGKDEEKLRKLPLCFALLFGAFAILSSIYTFPAGSGFGNILTIIFIIISMLLELYYVNFSLKKQITKLRKKEIDFTKSIEKEFKELEKITRRFSRGDLNINFDSNKFVYLKELTKDFNNSMKFIKKSVQEIQQSSFDISASTSQILSIMGQQASGSAEQAASVTEITSTMEELARTAAQIANNTTSVAQIADKTMAATGEGEQYIRESLDGIEIMSKRMHEISDKSTVLGDKSQQMSKILDIITDIASETHLLALNAAIEAASAGEYGKRFAVIANEVRRLAQKSHESVENIKNISDEFKHAINSNILATEEGNKAVKRVEELSHQVAIAFDKIKNSVNDTTELAKEISMATQQQRTASDQIVLTLKDISEVSRQSADGLRESTTAAKNLSELAMRLQLIAQSFTIDNQKNLKYIMYNIARSEEMKDMGGIDQKEKMVSVVDKYNFIELLYITDAAGIMKNYALNKELKFPKSGILQVGKDYSGRPWFMEAKRLKSAHITDPYVSILTDEECFTVAVPIYDEDEKDMIGILGADINVKNWTKI